jgi:hypothetical protein
MINDYAIALNFAFSGNYDITSDQNAGLFNAE